MAPPPGDQRLIQEVFRLSAEGRHAEAIAAATGLRDRNPGAPGYTLVLITALFPADPEQAVRESLSGARRWPADERFAAMVATIVRGAAQPGGAMTLTRAATLLRAALCLAPSAAACWNRLGFIAWELGLPMQATAYRRATLAMPGSPEAASGHAASLHYAPDSTAAERLAAARRAAALYRAGITPLPHRPDPTAHERRLRVGFVMGDLADHPVRFFTEGVFRAIDRERIEPLVYAAASHAAAIAELSRTLPVHPIGTLGDAAAAARIHSDAVDILIDLSGHTAGGRLGLFAHRPAPLQAGWIGYWGSTGLAAMDRVVADPVVLPPEHQADFTERPLLLSPSYLCFTPPEDAPPVAPAPAASSAGPTFGCYHQVGKITAPTIAAWAAILTRLPDARLILKAAGLAEPATAARLAAELAGHGVGAARVRFETPEPLPDMRRSYARIDVALDPFPFTGATTTAEALWMGVPVVTLAGDRFASRLSASLLVGVGLGELVAGTVEEYCAIAVDLADDTERLEALRAGLRQRMRTTIADPAGFAARLETALRDAWRQWCRSG